MKVRYTVEFTLPGRPVHGRSMYRAQLQAMLDIFCPTNSEIVDEVWETAETEPHFAGQDAEAIYQAAEAGGHSAGYCRNTQLRLVK